MASPTDALTDLAVPRAPEAPAPPPDDGLGNLVWRVRLPDGRPAVLKLHRRRKPRMRSLGRRLGTAVLGRKTPPHPAARRRTEARLLGAWREAGLDVPRVYDPRAVGLAPGPALVLEDLGGAVLLQILDRMPDDERATTLRRLGAAWRDRHRLALERNDPSFVMEHGTLAHVIVSGERLVTFDLEQAWVVGQPVLPLLTKEFTACLRSLAKTVDRSAFEQDVADLVAGYGDTDQLAAIVDEGLAPGSRVGRVVSGWVVRRRARRGFAYDGRAHLRLVRDHLTG